MNQFKMKINSRNEKLSPDESENAKLPRTLESTIFEILLAVILVVVWVLLLRSLKTLNLAVPIGFYIAPAITSVMALVLMFFVAYRPGYVNMGGKGATNLKQKKLKAQFARVLSLMMALLPLNSLENMSMQNGSFSVVFAFVAIVGAVVYSILIYRAGK